MGKSMVKKFPQRHEGVESQNFAFSSFIFVHHIFLLSHAFTITLQSGKLFTRDKYGILFFVRQSVRIFTICFWLL